MIQSCHLLMLKTKLADFIFVFSPKDSFNPKIHKLAIVMIFRTNLFIIYSTLSYNNLLLLEIMGYLTDCNQLRLIIWIDSCMRSLGSNLLFLIYGEKMRFLTDHRGIMCT